jgi:hypothetical protein
MPLSCIQPSPKPFSSFIQATTSTVSLLQKCQHAYWCWCIWHNSKWQLSLHHQDAIDTTKIQLQTVARRPTLSPVALPTLHARGLLQCCLPNHHSTSRNRCNLRLTVWCCKSPSALYWVTNVRIASSLLWQALAAVKLKPTTAWFKVLRV